MSVKINSLQLENVKRVRAVQLEPNQNGLTIIGGNNNQGKTSVLDSIAWLLGGNKFQPSEPQREGSVIPPTLKAVLSNGLVVERKGKNSALKVTDPSGKTSGQNLLDNFVEEFALNLPKFMNKNSKEKGEVLLKIIGVEQQLTQFNQEEKKLEEERLLTGRIKDQKRKFVNELPMYTDVPDELLSVKDLIDQQQAILLKNAKNKEYRDNLADLEYKEKTLSEEIKKIKEELTRKINEFEAVSEAVQAGRKTAAQLHDESTSQLEESISNVEETNRKVRANLDRIKADDEAKQYETEWNKLQVEILKIRDDRNNLLRGAALPLPGLSLNQSLELTYNGQAWDNMSSSQQLIVATAIVRALNPDCGFVLLDKLEQMDLITLKEFGQWLESEQLQAIATRVSTGEECTLIIEDGYILGEEKPQLSPDEPTKEEPKQFIPPTFTPPTF